MRPDEPSSETIDPGDFWLLAQSACDGTLAPLERDRLEALLQSDAELKKQYVAYLGLHAELQWRFRRTGESHVVDQRAAVVPIPDLLPPGSPLEADLLLPPRASWFSSSWTAFAFLSLFAIVVGIAGTELWWWHRGVAVPTIAQKQPVTVTPVAYLTSANGCAWGGDSVKTWTVGHSVESGSEIALHEGIAEFRLANGVSFGVEGPASLLLVSPSKLVLQYGKLTAHVPWGTDDFRVVSAGCRITARDAEFGLSLIGNRLGIHVFSGEVAAASSIAPVETDDEDVAVNAISFADTIVSAGQALRLMAQGEVLKIVGWEKAQPDLFVSKLSMSGPLLVSEKYVEQIKAAGPVSYWRFEQANDSKIPNEIESGPSLIIQDKSSLVGGKENLSAELHWGGEWSLKSSSRLPLKGSDYTVEAWVKPSHLHRGSIVSLECKNRGNTSARIELQGGAGDSYSKEFSGALRYVHRDLQHKPGVSISCFSSRPYAARRWQHLVAVKTKSQLQLYLDGEPVGTCEVSELDFPKDVILLVGHHSSISHRRFIGQIDELAVYDRALTSEEIVQHYKTVDEATKAIKEKRQNKPSRGDQPKEA